MLVWLGDSCGCWSPEWRSPLGPVLSHKTPEGSHSELMKPYSHPGTDSGNGGHKILQVRTINPLQGLHFLLLAPNYFLSPIIALVCFFFFPTWFSDFLHHFLSLSFVFFLLALVFFCAIHSSHLIYPSAGTCSALCAQCHSVSCGLHALVMCSHTFSTPEKKKSLISLVGALYKNFHTL